MVFDPRTVPDPDTIGELERRAEAAERELAATVKAKQENDERYMTEREAQRARAERAEARAAVLFDGLSHLSQAVHDWNDGSLDAQAVVDANKVALSILNSSAGCAWYYCDR